MHTEVRGGFLSLSLYICISIIAHFKHLYSYVGLCWAYLQSKGPATMKLVQQSNPRRCLYWSPCSGWSHRDAQPQRALRTAQGCSHFSGRNVFCVTATENSLPSAFPSTADTTGHEDPHTQYVWWHWLLVSQKLCIRKQQSLPNTQTQLRDCFMIWNP